MIIFALTGLPNFIVNCDFEFLIFGINLCNLWNFEVFIR